MNHAAGANQEPAADAVADGVVANDRTIGAALPRLRPHLRGPVVSELCVDGQSRNTPVAPI